MVYVPSGFDRYVSIDTIYVPASVFVAHTHARCGAHGSAITSSEASEAQDPVAIALRKRRAAPQYEQRVRSERG
eukprot:6181638-Pleurochrysis_carterae.AAC.3